MEDILRRFGGLRVRDDITTSCISVVSHSHGRARREERGIEKRELQEAIKYGRRERANPGRDGKPRWRYTHKGVVYITDESSRHEITSWRLEEASCAPPVPVPAGGRLGGAHVVVVVDHSGSMRKADVPGYPNRITAVYDCLAKDLVQPQLNAALAAGRSAGATQVSLIQMSESAKVAFKRREANPALLQSMRDRGSSARAAYHGHYTPALEAALDLLRQDANSTNQLFIVFLSDGAPSDHLLLRCGLSEVMTRCVDWVRYIGDLLGRDRVSINTVAFGPPDENYEVLEAMAKALPRGTFQKLGLSAACLRIAFTSLTSSLTSLRTEAGGGPRLTLRKDIGLKVERLAMGEQHTLISGRGWDIYVGRRFLGKKRWSLQLGCWEQVTMAAGSPGCVRGLAHARDIFAEGAERVVHQCSEMESEDGGASAVCVGPRLVAKESRFEEQMYDEEFHRTFARTQAEAEQLAQLFNRRLAGPPEWQLRFLPCHVYTLVDPRYSHRRGGKVEVLVEEELEGKYMKWNNNGGRVYRGGASPDQALRDTVARGNLGAIVEEDEEEDEYDDGYRAGPRAGAGNSSRAGGTGPNSDADNVPQAFSHFSYTATGGKRLVCDLQGVWNATDGFTLTDPVIHHHSGSKRNGATDKGPEGMRSFFATHTCNALCRRLGLTPGPGQRVQR